MHLIKVGIENYAFEKFKWPYYAYHGHGDSDVLSVSQTWSIKTIGLGLRLEVAFRSFMIP